MSDKNLGRAAGFFSVGRVVNRRDDPSQTGRAKVRWETGGLNQGNLQEDDLPWSTPMFPTTNPCSNGVGGPHTGFMENSRVIGFSLDGSGQDMIILGTMVSSGNSDPDSGNPTYDSDIPYAAKDQQNGGESQPRYDDKNGVVTMQSLTQYAQDQGGPDKKAADYASLPEPIGTLGNKIGG